MLLLTFNVERLVNFLCALAERRVHGSRHYRELREEQLRRFTQRIADLVAGLIIRVDVKREQIELLVALLEHAEVRLVYFGCLHKLLAECTKYRFRYVGGLAEHKLYLLLLSSFARRFRILRNCLHSVDEVCDSVLREYDVLTHGVDNKALYRVGFLCRKLCYLREYHDYRVYFRTLVPFEVLVDVREYSEVLLALDVLYEFEVELATPWFVDSYFPSFSIKL